VAVGEPVLGEKRRVVPVVAVRVNLVRGGAGGRLASKVTVAAEREEQAPRRRRRRRRRRTSPSADQKNTLYRSMTA
jgi:hypothetical protein